MAAKAEQAAHNLHKVEYNPTVHYDNVIPLPSGMNKKKGLGLIPAADSSLEEMIARLEAVTIEKGNPDPQYLVQSGSDGGGGDGYNLSFYGDSSWAWLNVIGFIHIATPLNVKIAYLWDRDDCSGEYYTDNKGIKHLLGPRDWQRLPRYTETEHAHRQATLNSLASRRATARRRGIKSVYPSHEYPGPQCKMDVGAAPRAQESMTMRTSSKVDSANDDIYDPFDIVQAYARAASKKQRAAGTYVERLARMELRKQEGIRLSKVKQDMIDYAELEKEEYFRTMRYVLEVERDAVYLYLNHAPVVQCIGLLDDAGGEEHEVDHESLTQISSPVSIPTEQPTVETHAGYAATVTGSRVIDSNFNNSPDEFFSHYELRLRDRDWFCNVEDEPFYGRGINKRMIHWQADSELAKLMTLSYRLRHGLSAGKRRGWQAGSPIQTSSSTEFLISEGPISMALNEYGGEVARSLLAYAILKNKGYSQEMLDALSKAIKKELMKSFDLGSEIDWKSAQLVASESGILVPTFAFKKEKIPLEQVWWAGLES